MAYSREAKAKARRLWLNGVSFERIAAQLGPHGEGIGPARWQTYQEWANKEDWHGELALIEQKAGEKRVEQEADKRAAQDAQDLLVLSNLRARIVEQIQRGDLSPLECQQLTNSMEKVIKSRRLLQDLPTEHVKQDATMRVRPDIQNMSDEELLSEHAKFAGGS